MSVEIRDELGHVKDAPLEAFVEFKEIPVDAGKFPYLARLDLTASPFLAVFRWT
ncbi:MAG: hypothetical protein ABI744_05130 [Chloroflexota bacterium]